MFPISFFGINVPLLTPTGVGIFTTRPVDQVMVYLYSDLVIVFTKGCARLLERKKTIDTPRDNTTFQIRCCFGIYSSVFLNYFNLVRFNEGGCMGSHKAMCDSWKVQKMIDTPRNYLTFQIRCCFDIYCNFFFTCGFTSSEGGGVGGWVGDLFDLMRFTERYDVDRPKVPISVHNLFKTMLCFCRYVLMCMYTFSVELL